MITVTIDDAGARAKLAAVGKALDPARVNKVATYGILVRVKAHLAQINKSRPNKLGGQRSFFYNQARSATNATSNARGGVVTISKEGFAQRLYGGTIRPVNCQYLAIPLNAAAYGKRMRDIGGKQVPYKSDTPRPKKGEKKEKKNPNVYRVVEFASGEKFCLVRQITQSGDRSVLPDDDAIRSSAARSVLSLIKRVAATLEDPDYIMQQIRTED